MQNVPEVCRACGAQISLYVTAGGWVDLYCRGCRNKDTRAMMNGTDKAVGTQPSPTASKYEKEPHEITEGLKWIFGCRSALKHTHPMQVRCSKAIRALLDDLIPAAHKAYSAHLAASIAEERRKASLLYEDEDL